MKTEHFCQSAVHHILFIFTNSSMFSLCNPHGYSSEELKHMALLSQGTLLEIKSKYKEWPWWIHTLFAGRRHMSTKKSTTATHIITIPTPPPPQQRKTETHTHWKDRLMKDGCRRGENTNNTISRMMLVTIIIITVDFTYDHGIHSRNRVTWTELEMSC